MAKRKRTNEHTTICHASRLDILPVYMITLSRRNSDKVTYNFWLRTCQLQFDVCWKSKNILEREKFLTIMETCLTNLNTRILYWLTFQYGDRRISQALISRNLHVLCPFSNIPHTNNMISSSIGMLLSTKKRLLLLNTSHYVDHNLVIVCTHAQFIVLSFLFRFTDFDYPLLSSSSSTVAILFI
jgi:hypothetical protein